MQKFPWVYFLFGIGILYMTYQWGKSEADCKKIYLLKGTKPEYM